MSTPISVGIRYLHDNHVTIHAIIDKRPDTCPFCHKGMQPRTHGDMYVFDVQGELVFQCPLLTCQRLFIGMYHKSSGGPVHYILAGVSKGTPKPATQFSSTIADLSPSFVKIHGEAEI